MLIYLNGEREREFVGVVVSEHQPQQTKPLKMHEVRFKNCLGVGLGWVQGGWKVLAVPE